MPKHSPVVTKTLGPIHFEDLEPQRLEDLVRELIYDCKDWHSVEATGRNASDEGFDVRSSALTAAEEVIAGVVAAASDLDLVGIYASGPVYRGFANSLGQRNWHKVTSLNVQWSLYHHADKAVKTAYGGFARWPAQFAAKMGDARERLALLSQPARTLEPGRYRAYLAPSAMEEMAGMLHWGGFSARALATRQSCLLRLRDGTASFDPAIVLGRARQDRRAGEGHALRRQPLPASRRNPRVKPKLEPGARRFCLARNRRFAIRW